MWSIYFNCFCVGFLCFLNQGEMSTADLLKNALLLDLGVVLLVDGMVCLEEFFSNYSSSKPVYPNYYNHFNFISGWFEGSKNWFLHEVQGRLISKISNYFAIKYKQPSNQLSQDYHWCPLRNKLRACQWFLKLLPT